MKSESIAARRISRRQFIRAKLALAAAPLLPAPVAVASEYLLPPDDMAIIGAIGRDVALSSDTR